MHVAGLSMMRKQRTGAFSLVELLVVIVILSVLITVGLQVQARLRDQVQAASCAQRLKTLGVALAAHSSEYRGQYPPTAGYLKSQWIQAGWTEFLQERGYLDRSQTAFCPSLDRKVSQAAKLSDIHPDIAGKSFGLFTYGLRSDHPGKIPPPYPVWAGSWADFTWNGLASAPISTMRIESPSKSIVVTDSIAHYNGVAVNSYRCDAQTIGWSGVDFRHSQKANALFADGHVAPLTREEMADLLEKEGGNVPYWNGQEFLLVR